MKKKVIIFGTFDGLHAGHLNFFKQARKLGDELIVVVARDINVKKNKGKMSRFSETKRLTALLAMNVGDSVILGQICDPYAVIRKYKPDIIALGYDQINFTEKLKDHFPKIKIVRLKPFKQKIFKSSLINK